MRTTLEGEAEVKLLVRTFYDKVLQDEMLAPVFQHIVKHNWDAHLQLMDKFWMNILFYTGEFSGNPMKAHKELHHFQRLSALQFEKWIMLFTDTVNELFEGDKAGKAKERANAISSVMIKKIIEAQNENTIVNASADSTKNSQVHETV
jgi:hemoglobin